MKKDMKILFYAPSSFGINEVFIKNLSYLGYDVIQIPHHSNVKLSLCKKIILFFLSYLINVKKIKEKLVLRQQRKEFSRVIKNIKHKISYGLIIRPDHFSQKELMEIKEKVCKFVGYQWDGLDRYPNVYERIQCFDRFFVFDEQDAIKYPGTIHTTNFYCDFPIEEGDKKYSLAFVGSVMDDRLEKTLAIAKFCNEKKLSYKFHCVQYSMEKQIEKLLERFQISKLPISFEENIKLTKQSKAIIDFKNTVHNGFSFRVFEAMGYGVKLITDNQKVGGGGNFFHPNNILITNDFNPDEIIDFLNKPYVPISEHIREYYSFSSWLKRILGEDN